MYLVITDQRQRRGLYDVRHYPCLKSRSRVSRIKTRVWTPQVWHTVRNQSLKFEHRWQSFKENSTNVVLKHAQKNPLTSPLRYPSPKMNIEDYLFLLYSCNDDISIKNLTTIAQCCKHVIMIFRWICNLGIFFFRKRGGWSSKRFSVSFYIAKYYILRYILCIISCWGKQRRYRLKFVTFKNYANLPSKFTLTIHARPLAGSFCLCRTVHAVSGL